MSLTCRVTASTFKEHQIGRFLSEAHFLQLQNLMKVRSIQKGEYLCFEEDPVEHMIYILEGHVQVYKSSAEGKQLLIHILQQGDFFGEFGGSAPLRSSFDVQAVQASQVGFVLKSDLEQLIASDGSFAVEFIKWIGLLQRTTESKFRDLLLYGKTGALASTLIRLANTYGKPSADGIDLDIKLTNSELANMIGTTRESVNRMLSTYREDGALSLRNGWITIHDLQYFRQIIMCPDCPNEVCRI